MLTILALPLAVLIITFYVLNIAGQHKALKSISESNYWLKHPYKWVFEAVMISVGICVTYLAFNLREKVVITYLISGISVSVGLS
jgi:hypothetical protein